MKGSACPWAATLAVLLSQTGAVAQPAPPPVATSSAAHAPAELTTTWPSGRQPSIEQRAQARSLFEQGQALMKEARTAEACKRFEASDRLAPGAGIKFNLAECLEQLGRFASAWSLYLDVATSMRGLGEVERETVARERAEALRPRMARLRIEVAEPVAGLRISRDAETVSEAQWGLELPIDPGSHRVTATAPEHQDWAAELRVPSEGEVVVVRVPALLPAAAGARRAFPPPSDGSADDRADHRALWQGLGLGAAGLGAAALGLGAGFAVHAEALDDLSQPYCDDRYCNPPGLELNARAVDYATAATVTLVLGAAFAVGGVVMFTVAADASAEPEATPRVEVGLGPTGSSLCLTW